MHWLWVRLLGNYKGRDKCETRFQATIDQLEKASEKTGSLVTTLSTEEHFIKTKVVLKRNTGSLPFSAHKYPSSSLLSLTESHRRHCFPSSKQSLQSLTCADKISVSLTGCSVLGTEKTKILNMFFCF